MVKKNCRRFVVQGRTKHYKPNGRKERRKQERADKKAANKAMSTFKKRGITSINKLYGSCFGGACQGRHEVTSKIMKDPKAVDAILKIGLFWEKNRERMYDVPQDEEIRAIEEEFPSETACPSWIEHKDHMRFLWGYTIGRRAMVLFNQGKITEDELYEEE